MLRFDRVQMRGKTPRHLGGNHVSQPQNILVDTVSGPEVRIRIDGKGTFLNSPPLKEFSREMMEAGRRDFIVDLQNCPSMDSTFMGTLAGLAMRLRDAGGGNLWVINRNERNAELLAGLGIDTLFSDNPVPVGTVAGGGRAIAFQPDKAATREAMHEAHEACIAVNPGNADKFRDVVEYLKASAARSAKS